MTPEQIESVKTYLLAVIAGGSVDPVVLLDQSKCFQCIDPETSRNLQNWLLCQIVNNTA